VGEFLTSDAKGKQLPAFIEAISEQLAREQAALGKELEGLQQNIDHIKQVVAMQQSYAKVSGVLENLPLHELLEDALRMASTGLIRHQIQVVRQYEEVPPALADRHKVLQILINLVSNAKHALEHQPEGRRLTLRVTRGEGERVRVEVSDNGAGIAPENLTRVFQHGFTTKKTGHGFGLHSGANAAKELGGSLVARSEGPGRGATFVLELPTGSTGAKAAAPSADSHGNDANCAA
jgi:signal transduction histidine kinase